MSNKIGGSLDSGPARVDTHRSAKRAGGGDAKASQPSTATTQDAQITDSARTLAALEQTLSEMPAVNEAKVESVRSAIANGTYQVNSERIADKLLQSERELARFE